MYVWYVSAFFIPPMMDSSFRPMHACMHSSPYLFSLSPIPFHGLPSTHHFSSLSVLSSLVVAVLQCALNHVVTRRRVPSKCALMCLLLALPGWLVVVLLCRPDDASDDRINFISSSPPNPTVDDDELSVFYTPTPLGNLDVIMTFDGDGSGDEWVGVGFGAGASGMGPAEFYTGIASESVVNRYLSFAGNGKPTAKATSNLISSDCAYVNGTTLRCSFTRPLADSASDAESLEVGEYYIRCVRT